MVLVGDQRNANHIIISDITSGFSSSFPSHIKHVTLPDCSGDVTCRFLNMDPSQVVHIEKGRWESRDTDRLMNVTGHRYTLHILLYIIFIITYNYSTQNIQKKMMNFGIDQQK